MHMMRLLPPITIFFLLVIFTKKFLTARINYVALGDSYTIGEGIDASQSFPQQLTNSVSERKVNITLSANLSRTGWTSRQLIDYELPVLAGSRPDFVTLLIGANDYNQGKSLASFQENLSLILERIQAKLVKKENIIVITIPDFTVTPAGKLFGDPKTNSAGIEKFNRVIKDESEKRNLPIVDIFELSQRMGADPSLVAPDGLHPSGKEYAFWVEKILPVALKMLK